MPLKINLKPFPRKGPRLTAFEQRVLRITSTIPFGETRSYAWVAKKAGRPKAVRAVGQALRKNPFPLLIPCHRVIHPVRESVPLRTIERVELCVSATIKARDAGFLFSNGVHKNGSWGGFALGVKMKKALIFIERDILKFSGK